MRSIRLLTLCLFTLLLAACQGGNILTRSTPTTAVVAPVTASPNPTFTVTPTPLLFTTAIPPAPLVVSEEGKTIIKEYPAGWMPVAVLEQNQTTVIDAAIPDASRYDAALALLVGANPLPESLNTVRAMLDQLHGAARARMAGSYESMSVYTNKESWGVLVTDTSGNWYEFVYADAEELGGLSGQPVLGLNPFSNQQIDWDNLFATTGRQLSSFVTLVKITDGMNQVGSANGWLVRVNSTEWLDARTGTAQVAVPPEFVKDEANNLFLRLDASGAEIQVAEVMIEDGSRFVIDSQTRLGVSPEGFIYHDVGEGKVTTINAKGIVDSLGEQATVGLDEQGNVAVFLSLADPANPGQEVTYKLWTYRDGQWQVGHLFDSAPQSVDQIYNVLPSDPEAQANALEAIAAWMMQPGNKERFFTEDPYPTIGRGWGSGGPVSVEWCAVHVPQVPSSYLVMSGLEKPDSPDYIKTGEYKIYITAVPIRLGPFSLADGNQVVFDTVIYIKHS